MLTSRADATLPTYMAAAYTRALLGSRVAFPACHRGTDDALNC